MATVKVSVVAPELTVPLMVPVVGLRLSPLGNVPLDNQKV
jgi:hypothetical protein